MLPRPQPEIPGLIRGNKAPGKPSTGIYPHISRKILASETGQHITTIAGVLCGRTRVTAALASKLARLIGVDLNEFIRQQERARKGFAKKQGSKSGK